MSLCYGLICFGFVFVVGVVWQLLRFCGLVDCFVGALCGFWCMGRLWGVGFFDLLTLRGCWV